MAYIVGGLGMLGVTGLVFAGLKAPPQSLIVKSKK